MKGMIFNLLEDFITENYSDEIYEEIISKCNLKTQEPFVGPGTYPDEDLFEIIGNTVEKLGVSIEDALKAFGKYIIPKLAEKFPGLMEPYNNPKDFLKVIDNIHYIEVKKLYKDAEPPIFTFINPASDRLIIRYKSKRKLYSLVEGLIAGVAEYYKTSIKQIRTIHEVDGIEVGDFDITFLNPV
ncbi:MAG: heme NO-binding domain-containing protein [Bacteroidia bacterium]|nr:heme NO-binding domain-containing protein [Bacteroidia bacterium]